MDRETLNVVVTGVGGGVGQSVLKALQGSAYTAIGVDGEVLATGLYAVARGYHGVYAREPSFVDRLLEICRRERAALLFPGLDAELPVLARHQARFREAGTIAVVSGTEVVDLCDDKLATARFLESRGFPFPRTWALAELDVSPPVLPLVLKPCRGGARSQGVHVVRDAGELERLRERLPQGNYVAQEWIDGEEYTCGSVNRGGRCFGTIVMRRVLRDGDTYKAFVDESPLVHDFVRRVLESLSPFGPCNVQLRVRGGVPYVMEFNARCSGTTACRALAGFNEPVMTAELLLHGRIPAYRIRPITLLRYWNELVVDNDRIATLAREGRVQDGATRLWPREAPDARLPVR